MIHGKALPITVSPQLTVLRSVSVSRSVLVATSNKFRNCLKPENGTLQWFAPCNFLYCHSASRSDNSSLKHLCQGRRFIFTTAEVQLSGDSLSCKVLHKLGTANHDRLNVVRYLRLMHWSVSNLSKSNQYEKASTSEVCHCHPLAMSLEYVNRFKRAIQNDSILQHCVWGHVCTPSQG